MKLLITLLTIFLSFNIAAEDKNEAAPAPYITTWNTKNPGYTNDSSIIITVYPTGPAGLVYNYDIDWENDGIYDEFNVTGGKSHTYNAPGIYQVAIRGTFPGIDFYRWQLPDQDDHDKLISIDQWGDIQWENMYYSYWECSNLAGQAVDEPDLSNVTDLRGMFNGCSSFNQTIDTWDVSTITNMGSMFSRASSFNQSLKSWDVRNVTSMVAMFRNAMLFNQDLNTWDVRNVAFMGQMFQGATSFNGNIKNWDISSVTQMTRMFENASKFDQSLGNWIVDHYINMEYMLDYCGMSKDSYDATLKGWKASSTAAATFITLGCEGLEYCALTYRDFLDNQRYWTFEGDQLSSDCPFKTTWSTILPGSSSFTSITIPTRPGTTYNYDIDWESDGIWDDLGVTGDITHNYGLIGTYQVSIRGDFPKIYFNNSGDKDKIISVDLWGSINWSPSLAYSFYGCTNLHVPAPDSPLSGGGNVNLESFFEGCTSMNESIGHWNVGGVVSMYNMFKDAIAFNQPFPFLWDTRLVENFTGMFDGATSFNQPINNWDVSSAYSMYRMFLNASSFNQSLNSWDVSEVVTMREMFKGAVAFNKPINNWNVSNVDNMWGMFEGASSFNQPLNSWDVGNVVNFLSMFRNASSFDQSLSTWDLSSANTMNYMLSYCGMSIANYDATLIGWETASSIPNGMYLGADGLQYCAAADERASLIQNHSWIISYDIQIPVLTNIWDITGVGNWHLDFSKWSLNTIPECCHDVLIIDDSHLTISPGEIGYGKTLEVQLGATLDIPLGAELIIKGN